MLYLIHFSNVALLSKRTAHLFIALVTNMCSYD